ncbi:MAG: TVP38/TMEM64 family protein [Candidatus Binatia bacterium]
MIPTRKKLLFFLGLLALIGLAYTQRGYLRIDLMVEQIRALGPWGPVAYIILYLIAPPLFIPGSAITLAGGALFGPFWGTLYTIFGATGGASLAFLIGRYLAGDWVENKAKGIMKRLKDGVEKEGWRFVAFTRLVPLFPFNVLNYAFGLTKIRFFHYVVASFFCMLPGAAAYTFIGYAGREAALGGEGLVIIIAAAGGLILFVFMLPRLIEALKGNRK